MISVPLGELTTLVMGQAPAGKDCNKEGQGTPFVKAGEFSERFPIIREWTTSPKKHAKKGDVLVCVVGATAGKVNDAIDCAIGRSVAAVRPNTDVLDHGYIYRFMQLQTASLRSEAQGMAQGVITREMINRLEIPLPPLEEQKRIAGILDQAAELCRLRTRALEKLNTLGQAIFHEMFGDLRDNSEEWKTKPIDEVCEAMVDCVNRTAPVVDGPTPWRMIRTTNVRHGVVNLDTVRYVEEVTFERWNRRLTPRPGDVLLTREAPVGEVGVLRENGVFLGQRLFLYRPNPDIMSPEFLSYQMMSPYFSLQFSQSGSGSTVKHLPLPACQSFEVRVPPIARQKAFDAAVNALTVEESRLRRSLECAKKLFASLQHCAFRGEL
ncbi:restriction endonuclease subunit S (plasmid) [Thioclava litoralis]|uniref:Restriction endonuclease subunit S n=1 Tax=Thioclava litoralis TaxID=3076557 RepID=A0ABZ1E3Q1_9RHOB|nr:restriction endonuclease subunit S [Thioclava sp. FTW29]